MILKTRKRFDKYVIGRRRESCGYRALYDAKYNDAKVVLTVYDVEQTPPTLFTDQIISSDLKPLPREVWLLDYFAAIPLDRILIETDESPELFGRILAEAAAMHLLSPSELAVTIGANFKRIFRHDPV